MRIDVINLVYLVMALTLTTINTSTLKAQTSDVEDFLPLFMDKAWKHYNGEQVLDEPEIRALCLRLKELTAVHFRDHDVQYSPWRHDPQGLRILPSDNNALGKLAGNIKNKADAHLIYSPRYFFDHPFSAASYWNGIPKQMIIPHNAMLTLQTGHHSIAHELVHLENWEEFYNGHYLPYHGSLKKGPVSPGSLALDEMLAYAKDSTLAINKLQHLIQDGIITREQIAVADLTSMYERVFSSLREGNLDLEQTPFETQVELVMKKVFYGLNHTQPVVDAVSVIGQNPERCQVKQEFENNRWGVFLEFLYEGDYGKLVFSRKEKAPMICRFFWRQFGRLRDVSEEHLQKQTILKKKLKMLANLANVDQRIVAIFNLLKDHPN